MPSRRSAAAEVLAVEPGSIGEALGLRSGDLILEIGGRPVVDLLDLQFRSGVESVSLLVERDGERALLEVDKDAEDGLGLSFTEELFDGIRRCGNNCVFCFVHQNPRGLRRSLYVKDEDFRLSFLYGNYVTLTNVSRSELERIVEQRLSPLYVSVHATDRVVRERLLGKRRLPPVLEQLEYLADHGIDLYAQVVLCPGVNDGPVLDRTISDLSRFHPRLRGVSLVPVGLTRFRRFLVPLRPYDRALARDLIRHVERWQARLIAERGSRLVHLADEFFLLAREPLPEPASYEGFEMREDGVGMIPWFVDRLGRELGRLRRRPVRDPRAVVFTGRAAQGMFERSVVPALVEAGWPAPAVVGVENRFYGPAVDVAGLLTGRDLLDAVVRTRRVGVALFCDYSLKAGTDRFIDDLTVGDLEAASGVAVVPVADDPRALLEALRDGRRMPVAGGRPAARGFPAGARPVCGGAPAELEPLFGRPSPLFTRLARELGRAGSRRGSPGRAGRVTMGPRRGAQLDQQ